MRCEKCGGTIDTLLVNTFNYDGSDGYERIPLVECEENAVYIDTAQNWTGYELIDEELLETIQCPICKQFPFKNTEIQTYEIVRVVCFKQDVTNKGGVGKMDKRYNQFAQYIETFIDMPKDPERGFYNRFGQVTDAGLLCALNCLFNEGVFISYSELAIECAKETGHFMSKNDISRLLEVG